jgi:hypothetical protein
MDGCAADVLPGRPRLRRSRLVGQLGVMYVQRSAYGVALLVRQIHLRATTRARLQDPRPRARVHVGRRGTRPALGLAVVFDLGAGCVSLDRLDALLSIGFRLIPLAGGDNLAVRGLQVNDSGGFFDRNLLHSNVTREDLATSRVAACAVVKPFDHNFSPECRLSGH